MAGPLTWREVSAPNFSGSASALSTFGTLLNNAAQAGQNAIAGWRQNQADQAGTSAMLNDMARRDPAAAEAMMRGVDPSTLNMGTLKQIQENQLNGMRQTQIAQAVQKGAYDMGRTVRTDQALDAASPYIQAMQQAAASGNYPAYQQAQAEAYKAGAFNGIPADKLQGILSGNQSNVAAAQASGGRSQQLADAAAVAQFGADALANDFGPAETAARIINDPKATPQQKMQMLKQAGLDQWGQAPAGTSSSGSGTAGGTKGKAGGAVAAPAGSAARINQLMDSLLFQESGGQQFNADGSVKTSSKGAIGVAQVMPDTAPEAARMAGLPWDENRYKTDPAYNKALGQAYFTSMLNKYGGDEEKALAAYNAGPGRVDKAIAATAGSKDTGAWLKALPQETQKYVPNIMGRAGRESSDVPPNAEQAAADGGQRTNAQMQMAGTWAGRSIASRDAQMAAAGIPNLSEIEKDQSSRMELAQKMTGKEGAFSGAKSSDMAQLIAEVGTKYKVQPSVAAAIIQRAGVGDDRWKPFQWLSSPNIRDMVNMKELDALGALVNSGGQAVIDANRDLVQDAGKTVSSAQKALKDAEAELAAGKERVKGRPGAASGLAPLQANVTKAEQALASALDAQERSTNLRPRYQNAGNRGMEPAAIEASGGPSVEQQAQAQADADSAGGRAAADLRRAEAALANATPGTQAYAQAERQVQKARRLAALFSR
ncbi:virion structural protein [Delftia phage RG-2014]|uniref:Lysozyme-like domain vision structural protein n=1 Tax=Delftia phage RG-2014 TaxID=1563661 RepID=A0A097PAR3_9CAUD|nr:virion structural protein [Delftia phage RG-2014]AIU44323.1 lysozyme-like domain vision structural protein [Delftia phage RG-2014]